MDHMEGEKQATFPNKGNYFDSYFNIIILHAMNWCKLSSFFTSCTFLALYQLEEYHVTPLVAASVVFCSLIHQ